MDEELKSYLVNRRMIVQMKPDSISTLRPLLIYDGDCGFCTQVAHWLAARSQGRLSIEAWQVVPHLMATLGLTTADGMRQAWFIDEKGVVKGGAAAANAAGATIWWLKPLTLLYSLPGIRNVEDLVYRLIAENRYRLPGRKSCPRR
jgi:predicted DCC family thiol-disulfide oxidoreductase YuxK